MSNTYDMPTALEELDAFQKEMQQAFQVKDNHIVVDIEYEYNIPLSGCRTYENILGWMLQLSEKTWMDREKLRYFVQFALNRAGLSYPRH